MTVIDNTGAERSRRRLRLTGTIKASLRELRSQLALLNHHVGARVDLRDLDLDCLDVIARYGPLSPSALARRAGLHPATLTGMLDRLARGGWIARERDQADRRAVVVAVRRERHADLLRLYAGMNGALDAICADYDEAQLTVLADFLDRAAAAGQQAAAALAGRED